MPKVHIKSNGVVMKYFIISLFLLAFIGCTDGTMAKFTALGDSGEITCYSGGVVFYHGFSTGKIQTESQSDGWYFKEKGTGNLIRVSGSCVIRN
jgi:hypothetical protein